METEDGIAAVKAARATIQAETEGKEPEVLLSKVFDVNGGIFVTIKTYPDMDLRGCIGFPEPVYPLRDALVYAAQSACHDPRFDDLTYQEALDCVVEVTVLTKPKEVTVSKIDLPESIVIGRDGLIIEYGRRRGLLLPQVPVEWGWKSEEFLDQLCIKAGLPPGTWKQSAARISSFNGEIFSEKAPQGEIVRE